MPEQFPEITEGLLVMGYAEADVRKILGENLLRLSGMDVEETRERLSTAS